MIAAHSRRIEKTDREKIFIIQHSDDFPKGSPVNLISGEIDPKIANFLERDAALEASHGGKLHAHEVQGDTRDFLIANLSDIVTGAVAIGDHAVPGITTKFNLPHSNSAENLLATADRWFTDTAKHEDLFITAGLDINFRGKLTDLKNDFRKAIDNVFNLSLGCSAEFNRLDDLMSDIMDLSHRRSALIQLKYRNNPSKLASWSIVSHLNPPPKRKTNIVMHVF